MRLLLLGLLVLPPLRAQIEAVYEAQPVKLTKQVLGSAQFGLWRVDLVPRDLATYSFAGSLVMAESPLAELSNDAARDLIARAGQGNAWSFAGSAIDTFGPLVGPGMIGFGYAQGSKPYQWAGAAVTGISLLRRMLAFKAPDGTGYAAKLLPDTIHCANGICGQWYVVTGLIHNLQPRLTFSISIPQDKPVAVIPPGPPSLPTAKLQPGTPAR